MYDLPKIISLKNIKNKRLLSNTLFKKLPGTRNDVKYDPNKNFIKIQKTFHKKNNFSWGLTHTPPGCKSGPNLNQSSFFLINCSIFYFLPFWAVAFPINFFSNFYTFYITYISQTDTSTKCYRKNVWDVKDVSDVVPSKVSSFKPSIFFSNYRKKIKISITNNCKQLNNIQFIIILFPFIFSFSLLIRSRYKEQFFSCFVKETLPGFCLPHQNISWETFNEITSQKIVSTQNLEQYSSFNTTDILAFPEETCLTLLPQCQEKEQQTGHPRHPEGVLEMLKEGDVKDDIREHTEDKKKQTHFFNTPNKKTGFVASTLPETVSRINTTSPDLIERLDISSNSILLEMKPVWEEQQKQLYIGFLPKRKNVTLEKMPVQYYRNGKEVCTLTEVHYPLQFVRLKDTTEPSPLLVEGPKIDCWKGPKIDCWKEHKIYARKPNFLSFSKNGISSGKNSNDLHNISSVTLLDAGQTFDIPSNKQYFQQKFVDLDELPLKLDQNYFIDFPNILKVNKGESIDYDKTYLLNTLFNDNAKQDLPNFSNFKKMKDTFSLFSTKKNQQFSNITTSPLLTSDISALTSPLLVTTPDISFGDVKSGDLSEDKSLKEMPGVGTKNDQFDLILPIKTEVSSRFLSGYRFPDTEKVQIGSLFIQNVYKDIIFQKASKKNLKIIIQVPSSFVSDFLNEKDSSVKDQQNILFSQETKKENLLIIDNPNNTDISFGDVNDVESVALGLTKAELLSPHKLNFNYLPASQTVLNKVLVEKSNIGGIYQKVFTIYKTDQTITSLTSDISAQRHVKGILTGNKGFVKVLLTPLSVLSKSTTFLGAQSFHESWEPVTFQSWLVITKLSFTYFVFKFLQYFYTNYGKDLLIIVLRFLDENLKDRLGLTNKKKDKGYRLIKKVKKAFKDLAGIDNILPELGEMVWVLLNSGNGATTFKFGNLLPKGFLFVGPPGTGKTFLVQAIAGEAGVPVLVQSGSSLTNAGENGKGAQRLKKLFEKARQLAPCIVFIDEIDTLGATRQNVMRNPDAQQGSDDLIQSLHKYNQASNILTDLHPRGMSGMFDKPLQNFKLSAKKSGNIAEKHNKSNTNLSEKFQDTQKNQKFDGAGAQKKGNQEKRKANQEQLNLLMQLLIELDGLKSRKGVIVIGATNRPKVLDPALTRPGRFDRVLNLEFPGKKKRIEILKLYSQNIGLADILTSSFPPANTPLTPRHPEGMLGQTSPKGGCFAQVGDVRAEMLESDVKSSVYLYEKGFSSFVEEPLTPPDTSQKNIKDNKLPTVYKKEQGQSTNKVDSFFNPLKSLPKKEYKETQKSLLQTSNLVKPKNKNVFSKKNNWLLSLTSLPPHTLSLDTPRLTLSDTLTSPKEMLVEGVRSVTEGTLGRVKKVLLKRDIKNVVKEGVPRSTKLEFPWEYLANRTFGFSAADLAAAMNQSSIQAILRKTGHTIETIEQGIESITSYSIEKPKIEIQKNQETFSCAKQTLKGVSLAFDLNSNVASTSPSNIPSRNVNKVQPQKGNLLLSTNTKTDVKESKTILQIPSLLFDVRLPKALFLQKSKDKKDPFFITRFAYYQAGKGVLHTFLPEHPDVIILKLWPQPKNSRHRDANFQLTSIDHRAKLETRLIGLYAGKAAELLFLCLNSHIKKENLLLSLLGTEKKNNIPNIISFGDVRRDVRGVSEFNGSAEQTIFSNVKCQIKKKLNEKINFSSYEKINLWQSNLGMDELSIASHLAHSLVDKWFFYSNKITLRKENQIFTNQNTIEFSKIELIDIFQQLTEEMQKLVSASNISESSKREGRDNHFRSNFQEWSIRPWWQNQITKETGNLNMFYDNWYRIYLPDPEESDRNEEWVIPDEYYHNTQNLKNILPFFGRKQNNQSSFDYGFSKNEKVTYSSYVGRKKEISGSITQNFQTKNELYVDITWNDLYKIDRDYIYHALILTCFNKAFSLLDDNRELLDYLADYLMRFETLRQHKIKEILCDFGDFPLTS